MHRSNIKVLMIIISEVWDFWGFVFPSLYISVSFGFIKIKNIHCFS